MNRTNKVIRLVRISPMKLRLQGPEMETAKLRLGMKTTATVHAHPDRRFEAHLTAINTASRAITVQAVIQKPERLALPGMFATGQIEQPTAEGAVHVGVGQSMHASSRRLCRPIASVIPCVRHRPETFER